MNLQLDQLLADTSPKILISKRKTMKFLLRAYQAGTPGMNTKPKTDILAKQGAFSFHYGCTDPEMRTLTSWLFTSLISFEISVGFTDPYSSLFSVHSFLI